MNRKIKFRALSEISKSPKWVYGTGVIQVEENTYKTDNWEMVISVNYDELDYFIPSYYTEEIKINTLGQFTGLYDKNGVEIYEGDLLRYSEDTSEISGIDEVFYNEEYGTFEVAINRNRNDTEVLGFYLSRLGIDTKYEVIGNIYESEATNE